MLGGIKAVVWTDVFQGFVMLSSVAIVAFMGVYKVGGFGAVWEIASEGGRLTPDFTFDLTTRATFWNNAISGILVWTTHSGFTQSCVQRVVSLPSLKNAQIAICFFGVGLLLIQGFCLYTGLVMYATYSECDPVKAGAVTKVDKMIPYFVQHIVGHLKGMPGFFISCVFSAALSTMSANLNSLSGIVYFDYIRPRIKHTEEKANFIMKTFVCVIGVYCILAGFLVEHFQSLLQTSMTISGVAFGCMFGVFMLGLLVPKAHSKSTLIAVVLSMMLSVGIVLVSKVQMAVDGFKYEPYPSSIEGCSSMNITVKDSILMRLNDLPPSATPEPFDILKLSFQWYIVLGSSLIWVIGVPLSFLMKPDTKEKVDPKLFPSIIQKFLPKEMDMVYCEVPLDEKKVLEVVDKC